MLYQRNTVFMSFCLPAYRGSEAKNLLHVVQPFQAANA